MVVELVTKLKLQLKKIFFILGACALHLLENQTEENSYWYVRYVQF